MRVEEVGNGRFVLADPVGRGTTGTVWRAWDRKHERFCAVRPVRRTRGGTTRFELSDGLRLRHAHLLTPYAAVEDGGRVMLAAQLVAGGSLRELLAANGPLAPSTVADLLDQMLAGLAALHAEGIAHHGIRAGAALLDATYGSAPRLWLAGFGSAARDPDGFDEDLLAAGTVAAALLDGPAPGRLAAVLDALRAQDPADRPTAVGAREALRVARPAAEPRTADGARVVILDRLPSLPAGWTPEGPPRLVAVPSPPSTPAPRGLRRRRGLEVVHSSDEPAPSFRAARTLHAVEDPDRAVAPSVATAASAAATASAAAAASAARAAEAAQTTKSVWSRPAPPDAGPAAGGVRAPDAPDRAAGAGPVADGVRAPGQRGRAVDAAEVAEAARRAAAVRDAEEARARLIVDAGEVTAGARAAEAARAAEEARAAQAAAREWLDDDWQAEDPAVRRRYRPEHARWKGVRGPLVAASTALVVLTGAGIAAAVVSRDPAAPSIPTTPTRAPAPTGPATAGGRCAWQQEGDVATVAGRTLRCTRTAAGYAWRVT